MYWKGSRLTHAPFQDVAYDLIRRQIHTGSVLPGEQLPAERKLADRLGISRATLRDALKRLEQEGYVVSSRGVKGGNFIATEDQINRIARTVLLKNPDETWRCFEFFSAIISEASKLACLRRNPSDIYTMETAIAEIRSSDSAGSFRKGQYDFIIALCKASLNQHFVSGAETSIEGMFSPNPHADPSFSADRLDELLRCIRQSDAEAAAAAARSFLENMSAILLRQMM